VTRTPLHAGDTASARRIVQRVLESVASPA
jgi:hypothetical protein